MRIAGLVLAAGSSRRMGGDGTGLSKVLAPVGGRAMVARAIDAAVGLDPLVVITGFDADRVEAALPAGRTVTVVRNPDPGRGLSSSLRLGLQALPVECDGVVVLLADMPRVSARHVEALTAAFDPGCGRAACVPVHGGQWGNPVLLGRRFFAALTELTGDRGARLLLKQNVDWVVEVEMEDDAVLTDVDTPDDMKRVEAT
jgi:molybdenum cofactor cytidylyltransferase